jgi:hypothetical protein
VNAFLEAESREEMERLSLLLAVISVGSQGDKRSIEMLQRELGRED